MLFTFLGTIVLGFGVAGTLMLLSKVLPLPRWIVPVGAGAAMLVFHVYVDYSWFERTRASLPPRAVVADSLTSQHVLQPWTLVVPIVDRFTVVDGATVRSHPAHPDFALAEVAFVARYYPTIVTRQLYDCVRPRRADMLRATTFGADGMPQDVAWIDLADDDPVRRAVCGARPATS